MNEYSLSRKYLKTGNFSDYIPLISTVTTAEDIYKKYFTIPTLNKQSVNRSPFYTHIKEKSGFRAFLLLIPFLGNAAIGFYDVIESNRNSNNEDYVLKELSKKTWYAPLGIIEASERLKNDREFMLKAVKANGETLLWGREWFREDREIVLEAVKNYPKVYHIASDLLKEDEGIKKAFSRNT